MVEHVQVSSLCALRPKCFRGMYLAKLDCHLEKPPEASGLVRAVASYFLATVQSALS